MKGLVAYYFPDGTLVTRMSAQRDGETETIQWRTYAKGEYALLGDPPLDDICLLQVINISNGP